MLSKVHPTLEYPKLGWSIETVLNNTQGLIVENCDRTSLSSVLGYSLEVEPSQQKGLESEYPGIYPHPTHPQCSIFFHMQTTKCDHHEGSEQPLGRRIQPDFFPLLRSAVRGTIFV